MWYDLCRKMSGQYGHTSYDGQGPSKEAEYQPGILKECCTANVRKAGYGCTVVLWDD